ncbi:hypothetical protein C9374_008182 [Naegleria lovaniensis]|uniref:Calpain catalytic domain-containing protein n=1 Tax=Naegleria lovaniensis TaxID=51637 RepID=A0AA88GHB5_NAELO|nr:uncharacterized protein C9374_008182 [Naegleria lovaniensis]KAG2378543.1 hypothetical protein C9374_008182 [Naegleria lovaniensis]
MSDHQSLKFNCTDYEIEDPPPFENLQTSIDESDEPFEDSEFPADMISVYKPNQKPPPGAKRIKSWLRPHQINGVTNPSLFVQDATTQDVAQGGLGDCWFIGALCVLSEKRDWIEKLVVSYPKHDSRGKYTFRFFRDGRWEHVTIDDRLPCDLKGNLVFGKCSDPNELWVPLIEKAYAKLNGSYAAIEGGFVRNALVDMTSGISEMIDIKRKSLEEMWAYLNRRTNQSALLGASSSSSVGETNIADTGLMAGHAYAVLQCFEVGKNRLIRLKNPWARGEWTGPWSDNSIEWSQNPKVAEVVNPNFSEDGSFHICLEDFCKYFTHLDVCVLINDPNDAFSDPKETNRALIWQCKTRWSQFNGEGLFTANTQDSRKGPQFHLYVSDTTDIIVSLMLHSSKYLSEAKEKDFPIGFHVLRSEGRMHRCFFAKQSNVAFKSTFEYSRENTVKFKQLTQGNYIIVPSVYFKDKVGKFILRVFVDKRVNDFSLNLLPPENECYHIQSIDGSFDHLTSGGCMNSWKWLLNPQYILTIKSEHCSKMRVRVSIEQKKEPLEYLGMYILKGNDHGQTKPVFENKEAAPPLPFVNRVENINEETFEMEANKNIVLVPCTFKPGILMERFTIRCYVPRNQSMRDLQINLELATSSIYKKIILHSEWVRISAGGCPNNVNSYWNNPKCLVTAEKDCDVDILLCQEEKNGKLAAIGFHVFKGAMNSSSVYTKTPSWAFQRIAFLNVTLQANIAHYIIPSTYNPGDERKFTLIVYHTNDCKFALL